MNSLTLTVKISSWGKNKANQWVTQLMNNINHWVAQSAEPTTGWQK